MNAQQIIDNGQILSTYGEGDKKVSVYLVDGQRVALTNGDPVWQDSDPAGFADLIHECESSEA